VIAFSVSFTIGGLGIGWRIWFCCGRMIWSSCRWCLRGIGVYGWMRIIGIKVKWF